MKISIDLDGVICRFNDAFVASLQTLYPEKRIITGYEPSDWGFSQFLSEEELKFALKNIYNEGMLWLRLKPYLENVHALQAYLEESVDVDVYYVTSREESGRMSVLEQSKYWLESHGVSKRFTSVVPVKSGKFKADVMRSIGIEYSLDDYGPTVKACNRDVAPHKAYLLDRPWNREYTDLPRVYSVSEYLDAVRGNVCSNHA